MSLSILSFFFFALFVYSTGLDFQAGFLVRVYPDLCLILIRAQIRAVQCASKSKLIRAQTIALLVLDKKTGLS
jgi:hypothetical protein